jgi:hypothetical protein
MNAMDSQFDLLLRGGRVIDPSSVVTVSPISASAMAASPQSNRRCLRTRCDR